MLKLTKASGRTTFINPAHIIRLEDKTGGGEEFTDLFLSDGTVVRVQENANRILALTNGRQPRERTTGDA